MQKALKSNIWKYFLLILTNRRNYLPILSIYFLTLPNSTAQQIGLYTGIGWFAGFLFEIPSGYISDNFGHKKTLILAKFSMLASTLFFIFGHSLPYFILGSAFISIGFAFTSGTAQAFLHNSLVGLKREEDYGDVDGKIKAKVSLVSAVMILALPLLTSVYLLLPLQVYLIFDIVGIFIAFSLYSPKIEYTAEDIEGEKIWSQLKRFKGTGFYASSLFIGLLGGFVLGVSPFKEPFVASLGLPIILIGSIMALSRVVWFFVGHNLKPLRKLGIKKLLFYEILIFSVFMAVSSQLKNPYLVGIILAVLTGYYYGRGTLISEYYLKNFLINKRYKATMLSIKQQIEILFQSVVALIIGFAMAISFSMGYLITSVALLISLLILYPFTRKSLN